MAMRLFTNEPLEVRSPAPARAAATWVVWIAALWGGLTAVQRWRTLPEPLWWLVRFTELIVPLALMALALAFFQVGASVGGRPRAFAVWAARAATAAGLLWLVVFGLERLRLPLGGEASVRLSAVAASALAYTALLVAMLVLAGARPRRWAVPVVVVAAAASLLQPWFISERWLPASELVLVPPVALLAVAWAQRQAVVAALAPASPRALPVALLLGRQDVLRGALTLLVGLAVSGALMLLLRHGGVLVVLVGAIGTGLGLCLRGFVRLLRATASSADA
jgi:hypothetical protein